MLSRIRAVCVSMHDVTPASLPACERLVAAIREVAPVRVTWLVVPNHHGTQPIWEAPDFLARMLEIQADGDELALHGWMHLDTGRPRSPVDWLRRRVATQGEGEFAGLSAAEAARRLSLGLQLYREMGIQVDGFVPPAWLLSPQAMTAVAASGVRYTSTHAGLHIFPNNTFVPSPTLIQSVRAPWRVQAFGLANRALAGYLRQTPLLRLPLHPVEVAHPGVIRHWQDLLERVLPDRVALTKSAFVTALGGAEAPGRRVPAGNASPCLTD